MVGILQQERKRKKSKRKKTRRINKLLLRLVLLFLVVSLTYLSVFNTDIFLIKNIQVKGNKNLNKNTIIQGSLCKKGENIFRISREDCEKSIENLSYVKEAKIKRKLPNTIIIQIVEREEIAAIPYLGALAFIDVEGYVVKIGDKGEKTDLPKVFGLNMDNLVEGNYILANGNSGVQEFLQGSKEIGLLDRMRYINFTNEKNTMVELKDKTKIAFGPLNDVKYKLSFLWEILKDIEKKDLKVKQILMNKGDNPIIVVDE